MVIFSELCGFLRLILENINIAELDESLYSQSNFYASPFLINWFSAQDIVSADTRRILFSLSESLQMIIDILHLVVKLQCESKYMKTF